MSLNDEINTVASSFKVSYNLSFEVNAGNALDTFRRLVEEIKQKKGKALRDHR